MYCIASNNPLRNITDCTCLSDRELERALRTESTFPNWVILLDDEGCARVTAVVSGQGLRVPLASIPHRELFEDSGYD
jgi:DUF917 family protein